MTDQKETIAQDEQELRDEAINEVEADDTTDGHITADEMDEKRKQNMAYEYLCHLEEAKEWMEACIGEELPITTELEQNLQNGVILAKLGHFFAPKTVPLRRIYDKDLVRYKQSGLHYRHTDNVVQFFGACEDAGLPTIFYPDTSDVYDRKNMPKLVYCIHALSLFLHKLGKAPLIQNLVGKAEFTEAEISAMRAELDKYGIQMPAFGKIGGILANEMPVDEAALHAAVIAINEAIDKSDPQELLMALKNPMAHISNVDGNCAQLYQYALAEDKRQKSNNSNNKLKDESEEDKDIYDVLLTQSEIQLQLNKVNVQNVLREIDRSVSDNDLEALLKNLEVPLLSLTNVIRDNSSSYITHLMQAKRAKQLNIGHEAVLDQIEVQNSVNQANMDCDEALQKTLSVDKVNAALISANAQDLYVALNDPKAQFPPVLDFASPLYFEEFSAIKEEKGSVLVYEEVYGGVKVLTAVAKVNRASAGSSTELLDSLTDDDVHLVAVEAANIERYKQQLTASLEDKHQNNNPLLTHSELQEIVDVCNETVKDEELCAAIVVEINDAIGSADANGLYELLANPQSKLQHVYPEQQLHYYNNLRQARELNSQTRTLAWEDIQGTLEIANQQAEMAVAVSLAVIAVNERLKVEGEEDNANDLYACLIADDLGLGGVVKECSGEYLSKLRQKLNEKFKKGVTKSGWLDTSLDDGTVMFYNAHSNKYTWMLTDDMKLDQALLNRGEIQEIVNKTTIAHLHAAHLLSNVDQIIKLQSAFRAYSDRKRFKERLHFMKQQEPSVIKLQAWTRGHQQRKAYNKRLEYLKANKNAVVKIQSGARMFLARKHYKNRLSFLASQQDSIVKIQSAWRGKKTREDYQSLMFADNPPLNVVRKFAHLLDQSDTDYAEEMELQKQRQQVVLAIRSNQQLEKDAKSMDIKIGLLVKNRITLEEVVAHEGKLTKSQQESSYSLNSGGLTSLNKDSQHRLNAYQHLFYELQVNPQYLARLILEMPQQQSTKFIESVILTLYNYASNPREEYLLLKLFSTSLRQEIMERVDSMTDIVTGNPLAVKMVVDFHRNARGHSYLRDMLHQLVTALLDDKTVKINTNPIEVYKYWINQQETESGVSSGLPYDVTNEEALKHEGVQKLMEDSIQQLRHWSDKFLSLILSSLDQIPYGMRYTAKVMYESLTKKFHSSAEKDVLKIVGNLLYYRYINSTIAAPDAYDIIDVDVEKGGLTPDQRRNLGSIAKILQFAASNKGFGGGDSQHLACLNSYIKGSHEKFKQYFRRACEVDEPEVHFDMDQYTDATLVVKPQIYISVNDLLNTHTKLLEYRTKIAPDAAAAIHELLDDLGEHVPDLQELMGADSREDDEICLTLSNKHEAAVDELADNRSLMISTKQLVVDIIRCQTGDKLTTVLASSTTAHQEAQHEQMIKQQEQVDARAVDKELAVTRTKSVKERNQRYMTLSDKKSRVSADMLKLEQVALITSTDHFQAMINMIAKDIRNQRKYRNSRRQDLEKLKATMSNLQKKKAFFESQIDYFKTYVKVCLDNMLSSGKRRSRASYIAPEEDAKTKKGKKESKRHTVKYSAAKLHERGIVLEIEGLNTSQFKNVQFEVSSTEDMAVFECTAKLLGVSETHSLKLEDLLQLQYEGVAVMEMFDRAKINVNLLIHFLNKKFYITK